MQRQPERTKMLIVPVSPRTHRPVKLFCVGHGMTISGLVRLAVSQYMTRVREAEKRVNEQQGLNTTIRLGKMYRIEQGDFEHFVSQHRPSVTQTAGIVKETS